MSDGMDVFLNMRIAGIRNCMGYTAGGDDKEKMGRHFRRVYYSPGMMWNVAPLRIFEEIKFK